MYSLTQNLSAQENKRKTISDNEYNKNKYQIRVIDSKKISKSQSESMSLNAYDEQLTKAKQLRNNVQNQGLKSFKEDDADQSIQYHNVNDI